MSHHLSFETLSYPREQQQAAWSSYIRDELFDADIQSFENGLNARMAGYRLDGLSALVFHVNGHTLQRTPELVAQSPKDAVFVSIVLNGQMTYYQPHETLTVGAGSAVVYPASAPYLLASQTGTQQLFIDVSAEIANSEFGIEHLSEPYMVDLSELTRGNISPKALRKASEAVDSGHPASINLDAVISGVTTNALAVVQEDDSFNLMREVRDAVKLLASDPETNSTTLAEAAGYSVRHVNRILARYQTSLAQMLSADRLARSLTLLQTTSLPLTDVALRSGFGSVSTMQRQLHKEGLGAPSLLRSR